VTLDDIRTTARSYFTEGLSPAHDWHHVQRVAALAERLLDEGVAGRGADVDERTVRLAVLLHDVGRAREDRGEIDDHATWGAHEAREILRERGEGEDRIEAVAHAIRVHRYSSDREPATVEAEVLCDADNLDALGAIGVARCFTYGGELGETIHDPNCPPAADDTDVGRTQFNHVHKKILSLPERMYTDAGRRIAADRRGYVQSFLERFDREVAGER
jgi:uncharacterized protein